jgi:DNA invertase Pin-like site-specific DNA recombinase
MNVIAYFYLDALIVSSEPNSELWETWPIDQIYQDRGLGSSEHDPRPQWELLLQRCQTDPPEVVLIRHYAELGPTVKIVSDRLLALKSCGVKVITLERAAVVDVNEAGLGKTASFEPLALQPEALEVLELIRRHHQAQRIRQGHARNRLKALPPPGQAPYGYRRGKERYVIDRSAAPIVKDFFERFLLYGSLREAVRYLDKKHGKKIAVSTGRRWLTHPVYRGDLVYCGDQIISDTHPPLLARDEAAQIDRLLRRNQSLAPRTASAPRSLAGLVFCSQCQAQLQVVRTTARRQTREYLYLRSPNCPAQPHCRSLPYPTVLEQTIQQICQTLPLAVADLNFPGLTQRKHQLEAAIATKQATLPQLPDLVATGVLDAETAELRAYTLRTEMAALRDQLSQLPPVNLKEIAQAVSIPEFWQDLSEPERRFFFREFIQRIQIERSPTGEWHLEIVFIF